MTLSETTKSSPKTLAKELCIRAIRLVCVNNRKVFEQTFARSTIGLLTPKPDLHEISDEETVNG